MDKPPSRPAPSGLRWSATGHRGEGAAPDVRETVAGGRIDRSIRRTEFRIAYRPCRLRTAGRTERGRARHRWIPRDAASDTPDPDADRIRAVLLPPSTCRLAGVCMTRCVRSPGAACSAAASRRPGGTRHRVQPLRHAGPGRDSSLTDRGRGAGAPPPGRCHDQADVAQAAQSGPSRSSRRSDGPRSRHRGPR